MNAPGPAGFDAVAIRECLVQIRAAARMCEEAGALTAWATLLGVADDLAAQLERAENA